jgi:hypothetical protein
MVFVPSLRISVSAFKNKIVRIPEAMYNIKQKIKSYCRHYDKFGINGTKITRLSRNFFWSKREISKNKIRPLTIS